jgi:hypothetical protein
VRKTTVGRASFLLRLRVQSDGTWAGQVEHIGSGQSETFRNREQLLERLGWMLAEAMRAPEGPERLGPA